MSTITSSQTVAGPAGMAYADVPSRIFAYIIDAIIMAVAFGILYAIFAGLLIGSALAGFGFMTFVWFVVLLLIYAAGSAIYFIYTWTKMRGSPGQRVLGLETLNAADGAVLTQPQAIRRWLFLFGPFVLAQVATLHPAGPGIVGRPAHVRLCHLPPLHGRQQPQPPGLPRRPGEHGRRQDQEVAVCRPRSAQRAVGPTQTRRPDPAAGASP